MTYANTWHEAPDALALLRCYDDLEVIVAPVAAVTDAMTTIYDELVALRDDAIDGELYRSPLPYGDNIEAADELRERLEASAITVEKAIRLTRDDAVNSLMAAVHYGPIAQELAVAA
jgi:hypothetical protein